MLINASRKPKKWPSSGKHVETQGLEGRSCRKSLKGREGEEAVKKEREKRGGRAGRTYRPESQQGRQLHKACCEWRQPQRRERWRGQGGWGRAGLSAPSEQVTEDHMLQGWM